MMGFRFTEFPKILGEFLQNLWEFPGQGNPRDELSTLPSGPRDSIRPKALPPAYSLEPKDTVLEIWLSGHGFGMISIGYIYTPEV